MIITVIVTVLCAIWIRHNSHSVSKTHKEVLGVSPTKIAPTTSTKQTQNVPNDEVSTPQTCPSDWMPPEKNRLPQTVGGSTTSGHVVVWRFRRTFEKLKGKSFDLYFLPENAINKCVSNNGSSSLSFGKITGFDNKWRANPDSDKFNVSVDVYISSHGQVDKEEDQPSVNINYKPFGTGGN